MKFIKKITKNRKEVIQNKNTKEFIICHHTGSPQKLTASLLRFFRRPDYISTHYIVGLDGDVIQYVEDSDIAFHAGKSKWKGETNFNNKSIGIEIISNGFDFTDKQRDAVLELNRHLMRKHNIPKENVLRHADIAGYRGKWDVGPAMYMTRWGSWEGFQNALTPSDDFEEKKKKAIEFVRDKLISNGQRPNDMITRGEIFVMLQRMWNAD